MKLFKEIAFAAALFVVFPGRTGTAFGTFVGLCSFILSGSITRSPLVTVRCGGTCRRSRCIHVHGGAAATGASFSACRCTCGSGSGSGLLVGSG